MNQEQLAYGARGVKHVADTVALAGLPGMLLGVIHLNDIYTGLGCIYLAFRIYETRCFKVMRQQTVAAIRRWTGY